ncbi:MAG: ATP-dependent Clp protease ATP-binding subunit [Candidatus Pacebacteria bacterium]|nr:ATP-dependent Clp protease ATP-binding subunit [Candidatus Paceibacterota bacterium]
MKINEAISLARNYSSVLYLNKVFPIKFRSFLLVTIFILFICATFCLSIIKIGTIYTPLFIPELAKYVYVLLSIESISLLLLFFTYALHAYSRYYRLGSVVKVFGNNTNRFLVTYEAGEVLLHTEKISFIEGLLSVPDSQFILNRLLIDRNEVIAVCGTVSIDQEYTLSNYKNTITLGSLWIDLYDSSEEFRKFLLSKKIQKEIYADACNWLDTLLEQDKRNSAWWWRENLSKRRGVGKSLSYGDTYFINKIARELGYEKESSTITLHKESLQKLEETLVKVRGANAVIVGSRGTGRHTIVKILSKMIQEGNCYSDIEHKRVFELDNTVLDSLDERDLINVLEKSFHEASVARNIIFVVNDLPVLHESCKRKGIDFFQIKERYITHADISVICICDQPFYQNEAHKVIFDKDFEVIHIEDMNKELLIPYIQDVALTIEKQTGTFFPSLSIRIIASSLTKYFVEDSPLVKASDLMYKVATDIHNGKSSILDEDHISETLKAMTGISTGVVSGEEKNMLLNLENILHKNIIGQHEAVKVVSSTMRRSRAGLVSPNKPIGSFLFLGPTGVGKTETAKALAEVFFGDENHMSRIDMNEYTMNNSSYRILGDIDQEGDLASCIHKRPYGVLLLDEFEKATTEVKDVFLRVLDEGVYTNGSGKMISARTQIIVATSNAGSDYIRKSGINAYSTKEEIEAVKTTLVDTIISDGLFRPELLNRFDAVVLFHPLGDDSRILIAKKLLESLKQRVSLDGYDVSFTDALVQKIVGEEDGVFGGRAIQRNIQTKVEEAIAKKIIEGSLRAGDSVLLDVVDVE